MRPKRDLAPKTRAVYAKVFAAGTVEADGTLRLGDLSEWPESRLSLLRAALVDFGARTSRQQEVSGLLAHVPAPYIQRRRREMPSEAEVRVFFSALKEKRLRIVCELLVGLGFRIDELLQLEREQITRALKSGVLYFLRKGGKEETLPVRDVKSAFLALLKLPQAKRKNVHAASFQPNKEWTHVWQVFSTSSPKTAYNRFHVMFTKAAQATDAPDLWSPHILRHLFATRMISDGAPLPVVQKALGHAHYQTTVQTYVHVDTSAIEKWLPKKREQ